MDQSMAHRSLTDLGVGYIPAITLPNHEESEIVAVEILVW